MPLVDFNPFVRITDSAQEKNPWSFYALTPPLLIVVLGFSIHMLQRVLTETITNSQLSLHVEGCASLGRLGLASGAVGFPRGLEVQATSSGSAQTFAEGQHSADVQLCRGSANSVEVSAQVAFGAMFEGLGNAFDIDAGGAGRAFGFVTNGSSPHYTMRQVIFASMEVGSAKDTPIQDYADEIVVHGSNAIFKGRNSDDVKLQRLALASGDTVNLEKTLDCVNTGLTPLKQTTFDGSDSMYVACKTTGSPSSPAILRLSQATFDETERITLGQDEDFSEHSRFLVVKENLGLLLGMMSAGGSSSGVHGLRLVKLSDMSSVAGPKQVSEVFGLESASDVRFLGSDGQGHAFLSIAMQGALAAVKLAKLEVETLSSSTIKYTITDLKGGRGYVEDVVLSVAADKLYILTGSEGTGFHVLRVKSSDLQVEGTLALDSDWMSGFSATRLFLDRVKGTLQAWAHTSTYSDQWLTTLPSNFGMYTAMSASSFWHGRLSRVGGLGVSGNAFPPHVSQLQTLMLRNTTGVDLVSVQTLEPTSPNLPTVPCAAGKVCLRFNLAELQIDEATRRLLTWQELLGAIGGFYGLMMSVLGVVNGQLQNRWNERREQKEEKGAERETANPVVDVSVDLQDKE